MVEATTYPDPAAGVLDLLRNSVDTWPDNPAMGVRDGTAFSYITYRQLWDTTDALAAGLQSRGVQFGDPVALLLNDRPLWGLCYLATFKIGAVAIPLDNGLQLYEWASIIREARPRVAIVSDSVVGDLQEECADMEKSPIWIPVSEKNSGDLLSRIPDSLLGDPEAETFPQITGQQTAAIVFTSGTTSAPKGVVLTHRNFAADVQAIQQVNLCRAEDRFLSVLPIHHTFESTAGFLFPLSVGASIAYARGLKSREITEDLRASQATIILGVPLLFEKVVNGIRRAIDKLPAPQRILAKSMLAVSYLSTTKLGFRPGKMLFAALREKAAINNLRLVVSGGAALAPDVAEFMDCIGVPILQGYGLTETAPVLSVNRPGLYKYDSIGPPLPGIELKIHEPNEQGIGEIAARGEMVTPGYFNRPDESTERFADDWLLTGDLGWRSEDGHFHIVGRQKNMLVTPAGKNVYPEEIEMLLAASPLILEALVYNDQDPDSGRERIACAVVPDQEYIREDRGELDGGEIKSLLIAEIRRLCETIAAYKRPKLIIVREQEFEKTTTRKIKRFLFARTKEKQFPVDRDEMN